jgi:predicted RNA-binding Zn-ribbon protein involved in translation (DUF1610 family)
MQEGSDEVQLTKLESIFAVGIIGCMLFATWELAHLIADEWLREWVKADAFTRRRIIYYGISFTMAISSVVITTRFAFSLSRFGKTINRAFLWYGTLLLISTIAIFVFDCLPEVFAGFIGAGVFVFAIYILQKKYFTKERMIMNRLEKGKCFSCGATLHLNAFHCPACGIEVGRKCSECNSFTKLMDKYCSNCGAKQD